MKSELVTEIARLDSRIRNTPADEREPLRERRRDLVEKLRLIDEEFSTQKAQEHRTAYESLMPFSSYLDREPLDTTKVSVHGGSMKRRKRGEKTPNAQKQKFAATSRRVSKRALRNTALP